ncbi:MAG: NAD(P)H-dependent dehydrogenase/reductase [Deltaproteobacteria bacterium]|nr:MAG: NAD(P)H-dependent dehydrogenase/reductase [Deltaproteobacteria bacterium]
MLDILRKRRSIRQFEARPVEQETIELLIEAALRAPSSRGLCPWEFVVVTDPQRLKALSRAKPHGAEFLARAPLAIVVAADPERCDVWVEDCAIAAIVMQLTAVSLGLGSCWAQIRLRPHGDGGSAEAYVREIVALPERMAVDCIIGFGYPQEKKAGHAHKSLPFAKVHREIFGGKPAVPT